MKKKGHIDKLDKKTQNRHFSHELWGGKGSHPRKITKESSDNYSDGWDRIWGNNKRNKDEQTNL